MGGPLTVEPKLRYIMERSTTIIIFSVHEGLLKID